MNFPVEIQPKDRAALEAREAIAALAERADGKLPVCGFTVQACYLLMVNRHHSSNCACLTSRAVASLATVRPQRLCILEIDPC